MTKKLMVAILLSCGLFAAAHAQEQDTTTTKSRLKGRKLTKGTWNVGATLSLKSRDFSNTDLVIVNLIDFKQNAFNVRAETGYFIKENLSVGLAVEYGQQLFDVKGTIYNNDDMKSYRNFNRSFAFTPFIKNYISMSHNNVFYITNQTEIQYLHREGTTEDFQKDKLNRTYTTRNQFMLGIRPGIMVFFTKNLAFETNIGILGLNYYNEKATHTNKPDSKRTATTVDFKFDILKLGFGFSYYF